MKLIVLLFWIFSFEMASAGAAAAKNYDAIVVKVIDGDTLEVRIKLWKDLEKTTRLRIRGIDAPELKGKCAHEKSLAKKSRRHLKHLLGIKKKKDRPKVSLHNVRPGKYHREISDLFTQGGQNVGDEMISAGFARPYQRGKRASWCP